MPCYNAHTATYVHFNGDISTFSVKESGKLVCIVEEGMHVKGIVNVWQGKQCTQGLMCMQLECACCYVCAFFYTFSVKESGKLVCICKFCAGS